MAALTEAAYREVPTLVIEPESTDESDDEKQQRKKTPATPIKLTTIPTVINFRTWLSEFYQKLGSTINIIDYAENVIKKII